MALCVWKIQRDARGHARVSKLEAGEKCSTQCMRAFLPPAMPGEEGLSIIQKRWVQGGRHAPCMTPS